MESKLTAKANISTQTILYLLGVVVVIIITGWFATSNPFSMIAAVDSVNEDLKQLTYRMNNACNTLDYYSRYNPITENAIIEFFPGEVCVSSVVGGISSKVIKRCAELSCKFDSEQRVFSQNVTYIGK